MSQTMTVALTMKKVSPALMEKIRRYGIVSLTMSMTLIRTVDLSSNEEEWNDSHWQHDMTHNDHDAIEEGGRESDIINSQLELMKTLQDENFMLKWKVQQSNICNKSKVRIVKEREF